MNVVKTRKLAVSCILNPVILLIGALMLTGTAQPARAVNGYVNVAFPNGYQLVANPLSAYTNRLNEAMNSSPPDGTMVFLWDVPSQSFGEPAVYISSIGEWSHNYDIPVGMGFAVWSPTPWINTFVGQVLEGSLTNKIFGNNRFTLVGSKVPQAGPVTSILGFTARDNDLVYTFDTATQAYKDACTYFASFGWYDPTASTGPGEPSIAVAQPFFVQHAGADYDWVRVFIVNKPAGEPPTGLLEVAGRGTEEIPAITRITLDAKTISLVVLGGDEIPYNVEFSRDQVTWTTLATNQKGAIWKGPYPDGPQGYYRVSKF